MCYWGSKYVIEVSDIKPTTYNQRLKIIKLYYQKLLFPNANHIAILRAKATTNKKVYRLSKITKDFLEKEKIILLSLENIDNHMSKLLESIKNNENINQIEKFVFNKKRLYDSKRGCITQSKKIDKNEQKLNKLLMGIGGSPKGPSILNVKDDCYICVDNYEEYKNTNIAYEITSSNSNNSLRALAGKILLYKIFNKNLKFVVIINNANIFNNTSLKFLKDLSDYIILKKSFNKEGLKKAKESITQVCQEHNSYQKEQGLISPDRHRDKEQVYL